jgi:putative ABC transport system permease protein
MTNNHLMHSPIIFRLAQRYISRRLFQSVLFVLGIALGVAVVIAIDIANSSASRAFHLSAESISGKATHQIIGGPSGLPSDLYRRVRQEVGLRESAPIVEEYVQAQELGSQPLRLLGVDPLAEPPFRAYLSTVDVLGESEDNAFNAINAFIAEPNTVLISETMAARFNIHVGDTVTLQLSATPVPVRIVGFLRPDDRVSEQALDNLLLADIATAQEILSQPGVITRIDLILPADYDFSALQAILPPGATLISVSEGNTTLDQMTAAFELNLQALSLLALVVGVFLIYNTVTFSVVQRRPVIGILRSVGATKRQIFGMILGEAVLLGFIGTLLGLAVGVIFGRMAVSLVSRTISDLYFSVSVQGVTVEPFTLVKGAAIGLFASIIAALIPSYDATRTPPAGTLRRSDMEQNTRRHVPLITFAAVAMNAVGLFLLRLPTQDLVISFLSLFCFVVGGALYTPLVLILSMRLSTPLANRLFGVLGRMAPRAVIRSLSRTSVAVAALTVAVSVIVGVSVMISSFRLTVADWLETTLGADIYISPPFANSSGSSMDVDPALADLVRATDGIARVETVRAVNVTAPDYPDLPPVNLAAASSDITSRPRRFAWNILDNPADYWTALNEGKLIVTEPFAFRRGLTPENNQLTLLTDRGERTFTVVGAYYDYSTDQGSVFMAQSIYRDLNDDPYITSIAAFIEPDADVDTVINTLRTQTLVGTDLEIQSYRALRSGVFEVFDNAFAITVALRLLATVVAFIGILSALMSLQLEQTRQYGIMRAVGLTPRQLWNFTLIQTGLMGGVAGLLALPIGLVLALVLIYVINVRSFGWTMQLYLSPNEFLLAFAVAVIAALAAGLYPAWRLSKLITAQALRSE